MNHLIAQRAMLIDMTHNLRTEILEVITDTDLIFSLGGSSLSLADLLLEQGRFQMAYTRAFGTFKLIFDLQSPTEMTNVIEFKTWFETLDTNLVSALNTLSNDDLKKTITRVFSDADSDMTSSLEQLSGIEVSQENTWGLPAETTFFTYREAVFIFAAKASVYLRALGKPLPVQLADWIA